MMGSPSWLLFRIFFFKAGKYRNSSAVQWLGLGALTDGAPGSIPGRGTKIPQATMEVETLTVITL